MSDPLTVWSDNVNKLSQ